MIEYIYDNPNVLTLRLAHAILLSVNTPTLEPRLLDQPQSTSRNWLEPPSPLQHSQHLTGTFRRWYWTLIPLIAVVGYVTVLRIGFLSDDFQQLYAGRETGVNPQALLTDPIVGFFRPVGFLIIYELGWKLWGYNPLPYHLVGLLAHAASSLLLGLWLAETTGRRSLGWLAGVLFAVFPLHLEALGWIAAQFDTFALLFALGSLWCFTSWWRRPRSNRLPLYLLSLLLYTFGVFTKETLLTFVPVFVISAWIAAPPIGLHRWRMLAYALLPFGIPILLNMGLRLLKWGTIGGYGGLRTDYGEFFWDRFVAYFRYLISPISGVIIGDVWVQTVGALSTIALIAGLVIYGRSNRKLILLASVWIILPLVPVLNIPQSAQGVLPPGLVVPPGGYTLEHNRYLYIPAAGYCVGVAALLYSAITSVPRFRRSAIELVTALVTLAVVTCWIQLRPWHTATTQVNDLVGELLRLIPSHDRPNGMIWYTEGVPHVYEGVPLLYSGLGISRIFANGGIDYPNVQRLPDATQAPIANSSRDAFALRFKYIESDNHFHVDYLSGITGSEEPPVASEVAANFQVWNFDDCTPGALSTWKVMGAKSQCVAGRGLLIQPDKDDPQLLGPGMALSPTSAGARFVRLRVSVRYPASTAALPYLNEWFWKSPDKDWDPVNSKRMLVNQDGEQHVYWTFLSLSESGNTISTIRFDPVNAKIPAEVQWIALDLVK